MARALLKIFINHINMLTKIYILLRYKMKNKFILMLANTHKPLKANY